jgi:predicted RNA-binding Zn ribbon-like protein
VSTAWTDDHFVGGDVALDFANTVYRRKPECGPDLLDSTESLTEWLRYVHLLPDAQVAVELDEARGIRTRFWAIFQAQADGHELPADALSGLLDRGIGDVTVGPDGSMTAQTARGALTVVALHGLRLALSPPDRPVRTCDRCGWFFVDTSRGRRRRWCNMRICGNQAKAARYRSTH